MTNTYKYKSFVNQYAPSAYHDPREVVIKHLIAELYWDIAFTINECHIEINDLEKYRIKFVGSFNSQHDYKKIIALYDVFLSRVVDFLTRNNKLKEADILKNKSDSKKDIIEEIIRLLKDVKHVDYTQGYVADGIVRIADKEMEVFASNKDYIGACLELLGDKEGAYREVANAAWIQGFTLRDADLSTVTYLIKENPAATDLITELMSYEQKVGNYDSIQQYEYHPGLSEQENAERRENVIKEGFYLMGKIMAAVAMMNNRNEERNIKSIAESNDFCSISAFLDACHFDLTSDQKEIIKKIMLIRATHGLSPGEFAARIAGSVRLTFPRALINAFIIRTGKTHGGALSYCMEIQEQYLRTHDETLFAEELVKNGNVSGFGHRIHKYAGKNTIGADPRVAYMIREIYNCFPDKKAKINRLLELADKINRLKPNLSPNTDYAAGIMFHCLEIAPEAGLGIFTAGRLPGLITEIIRQLDYKSNSLRPPLPVVLPYAHDIA